MLERCNGYKVTELTGYMGRILPREGGWPNLPAITIDSLSSQLEMPFIGSIATIHAWSKGDYFQGKLSVRDGQGDYWCAVNRSYSSFTDTSSIRDIPQHVRVLIVRDHSGRRHAPEKILEGVLLRQTPSNASPAIVTPTMLRIMLNKINHDPREVVIYNPTVQDDYKQLSSLSEDSIHRLYQLLDKKRLPDFRPEVTRNR